MALQGSYTRGRELMPRSPRQDHEGAWQHVMNRGIGRQAVFRSDDDRQVFYDCVAAAMPRYGVQVHAWCLLDNHFHLLWPWSSAQAYLGLTRTPAWLHTEAILEMLGPHDARQRYRELLGEEIDPATQSTNGEVVPWGQTRRV